MKVYVEFLLPRKSGESNELKDPCKVLCNDYPHINATFEKHFHRGTQNPSDKRGVGRIVIDNQLPQAEQDDIKTKVFNALFDFSLQELANPGAARDLYNTLSGGSAAISGEDLINMIPINVSDV